MLELPTAGFIEVRLLEQRIEEGPQVEPSASNDECHTAIEPAFVNPFVRISRPRGGRVALGRLGDVDPAMGHGGTLSISRLRGADVEAPIDLTRVRDDEGGWHALGKPERDLTLPGGGGSADHRDERMLIGGQSGARARPTRDARRWSGHGRRGRAIGSTREQ